MKKIMVNGEDLEWRDGMTVQEVLDLKKYTFRMLVIRVNGQLVKKNEWADFIVPENSEVKVIHLMSGG